MVSLTSSGELVKTSVQLRPDQIAAMQAIADEKHIRWSVVLRMLLDAGLERQQKADQILRAVG